MDIRTCKKLDGSFRKGQCRLSTDKVKGIRSNGKPILKEISIKTPYDEMSDLSHLGEFSDSPSEGAIQVSDGGGGKYRYFNPANPEYAQEEYKRMMEFENGQLGMLGVMAKAEVHIPIGNKNFKIEEITSGGIWGVATDSGLEFMADMAKEQVEDLIANLKSFGIKKFDIPIKLDSQYLD